MRNLPIQLAVTEWGAFRGESHTDEKFYDPPTAWDALFIATMLKNFVRRAARVGLANSYSLLHVMPSIVARGPRAQRTAYGDLFAFWKELLPSEILELKTTGPSFVPPQAVNDPSQKEAPWLEECTPSADGNDAMPWLDAVAGKSEAAHWLMMTNFHPQQAMEVLFPIEFDKGAAHLLVPHRSNTRFEKSGAVVENSRVAVPSGSHCKVFTA